MSETLDSGLPLTIPSAGETNWATLMQAAFQAISAHDHTEGKGAPITTTALAADCVTAEKILLANTEYIRGRDSGDSFDVDLIGVGSDDSINIPSTGVLNLGAVSNSNSYLSIGGGATLNLSTGTSLTVKVNGTDKLILSSSVLRPDSATIALGNHANPFTEAYITGFIEAQDGSAPSNPSSGYIRIYSQSGVLKYKQSDGTVKTITTS